MPHSQLDLDFIRGLYPDSCWEWAFFENAGGSFVPLSVIERMTAYISETQVQPGAPYPSSALAGERMAKAKQLMAELINADDREVTIGASTSMNVYVLAQALRPLWREGDEIIVTELNHEANAGSWRRLAEFGINTVEWPVDPDTGILNIDNLDQLLTDRTRLIAFPHVSNITGDINDVAKITAKAHDAGAMVCVDGVAYAPHRAIDVKAWDVDFYSFSFYKIYGPHIGCLFGRYDRLLEARGQYHYFIDENATDSKLNPAGPNHETIASLHGIADYFEALAGHHLETPFNSFHERVAAMFDMFTAHEETMAKRFLDFIDGKANVRLLGRRTGDGVKRAPTFSFVVDGRRSADIARAVEADRVAIRNGHFYAKRLVEAVGIGDTDDGVVRCSMVHYNTPTEIECLITALDKTL